MKPPLHLPAAAYESRVRLRIREDHIKLTDSDWRRRCGAFVVATVFGIPGVFFLLMSGLSLYLYAFTSGSGSSSADLVGGGVIFLILGFITTGATAGLMIALRLHRRFTVNVDILRRTCICRSWCFGVPARRVETQTDRSTWNVSTLVRTVPSQQGSSVGRVAAAVILFLIGPLGWLIGAIVWSVGRGGIKKIGTQQQELVVFQLEEGGLSRVQITMQDGDAAEAFLLAWDRYCANRL